MSAVLDKPNALPVLPAGIPQELRQRDQWVGWRFEARKGHCWSKVPVDVKTSRAADVTRSASWSTCEQALAAYSNSNDLAGIGFVFDDLSPFSGFDLDDVRDPGTGALEPWAGRLIQDLQTYAEVSPSECGVKLFVRGKVQGIHGKRCGGVEYYSDRRFFTTTGHRLEDVPSVVQDRQQLLPRILESLFSKTGPQPKARPANTATVGFSDGDLIAKACAADPAFASLWQGNHSRYRSQSEGDLALCHKLAFWTAGDAARVDALFRASGLMREKWDARRGAATYGSRTLALAITSQSAAFVPRFATQKTIDTGGELRDTAGEVVQAGCNTLLDLARAAYHIPTPPPAVHLHPSLQRLARLCVLLQQQAGTRPFFLACRPVAVVLGVNYSTISRWLNCLVRAGLLRVVTRGRHGTGRASEFLLTGV